MKKETNLENLSSRRHFIKLAGLGIGSGIVGMHQLGCQGRKKFVAPNIEGFEEDEEKNTLKKWIPVSDRIIRVGLVGYGASHFGAAFGFQNHPNVEVVAVSDLFPDRCAKLAEVTKAKKTYPSLEELVKDDSIEAVFVATDAPSHARHCIEVLKHGKHVAVAVPAVWGSLEDAEKLFETVKQCGLKYMMFETSCFRENLYAMRQIYRAGGFGKLVYTEGEYWTGTRGGLGVSSYNNWRKGSPPQWYITHANAYYMGVTDGTFIEVSCLGVPGANKNKYNNPYLTEIALCRTSEGGIARMGRCKGSTGKGYGGETGRVRGEKGSYYDKYEGLVKDLPDYSRPPLPPGVDAGGHGGSHGLLMDEFVTAILQDHKPLVDICMALNITVPGIIAHQSALKDGEWMQVPQYKL